MVVCVECLPADKPWDVVFVTRLSSGVAPRACVRVYARVLVPPNLYIHTYIQVPDQPYKKQYAAGYGSAKCAEARRRLLGTSTRLALP